MKNKHNFIEDENVKVQITKISGRGSRYGAWSVDAKAWIEDGKEKNFEKTVKINVLKEDNQFGKNGSGVPRVVERIKQEYAKIIREDSDYQSFKAEELESEKNVVEKVEGKVFEP